MYRHPMSWAHNEKREFNEELECEMRLAIACATVANQNWIKNNECGREKFRTKEIIYKNHEKNLRSDWICYSD